MTMAWNRRRMLGAAPLRTSLLVVERQCVA
jgi:hypothetical protein